MRHIPCALSHENPRFTKLDTSGCLAKSLIHLSCLALSQRHWLGFCTQILQSLSAGSKKLIFKLGYVCLTRLWSSLCAQLHVDLLGVFWELARSVAGEGVIFMDEFVEILNTPTMPPVWTPFLEPKQLRRRGVGRTKRRLCTESPKRRPTGSLRVGQWM